uniref:Uncharacterized protein n=1 Tax=Oryza punctata TaxID=4537 RepID=A0A0E0KCY1_ORYPU
MSTRGSAPPHLARSAMPLSRSRTGRSPPSSLPEPRSKDRSRSFCVEMANVNNCSSSTASCGTNLPTNFLGSFDYHIDEEVNVIVSRIARGFALRPL